MNKQRYLTKNQVAEKYFLKGFLLGSKSINNIMDYGFGDKGLGTYVYDKDFNILAFVADDLDD